MAINDYKVTHSNYTIKKKHKIAKNGTIFERDYMTILQPGVWGSDTYSYGEGNFKMVSRRRNDTKRKRYYGEWAKPECASGQTEYWDATCITTKNKASDGEIILKPNYQNLPDFAYFGSLEKLFQNTVSHIINNYPGELYITEEQDTYWDGEADVHIGDNLRDVLDEIPDIHLSLNWEYDKLYRVENPLDIDYKNLISAVKNNSKTALHYLLDSYQLYGHYNNGQFDAKIINVTLLKSINKCKDGDLTAILQVDYDSNTVYFFEYYLDGKRHLYAPYTHSKESIRPHKDENDNLFINEFFKSLSPFGRLLLNKRNGGGDIDLNNPETFDYTCKVNSPYEDEDGFYKYTVQTYTWPISYGYNLDTESLLYENYIISLLNIIEFYEEGYTNNIWNRMVHSPIKNMDRTFERPNSDDDNTDYDIGILKMESIIQIASAMFDDLKGYIDGMKNVHNVTYSENDNTPDYFLSDTLELSGWEVSDPTNGLNPNDGGRVNTQFYRNLKINSRAILSRKGTKEGIEMLLNLFGLRSYDFARLAYNNQYGNSFDDLSENEKKEYYDYKIEEQVYIAEPKNGMSGSIDDEELPIETFNRMKTNYDFGQYEDTLQGLPCIFVYKNGMKYVVPWFKDVTELDGQPYFQMYGGWGKKPYIENNGLTVTEADTTATEEYGYSYKLFDESINYVHITRNIGSLSRIPYGRLHDGDIYYVYDLSDYNDFFTNEGELFNSETTSNYFFIGDKNNNTHYGSIEEGDTIKYGWVNVPINDVNNGENVGARVVYLESIIDDMKGNNPHTGNGAYDLGKEYLDYFRRLFKYSIDSDNFTDDAYNCGDGKIDPDIEKIGYNLTAYTDNMKCWYFTDHDSSDKIDVEYEESYTITPENDFSNRITLGYFYANRGEVFNFGFHVDDGDENVVFRVGNVTWSSNMEDFDGVYTATSSGRKRMTVHYNDTSLQTKVNRVSIKWPMICDTCDNNDMTTTGNDFISEINTYDYSTGIHRKNTEMAAMSVINSKGLKISFDGNYCDSNPFKEYFYSAILPYLKQIIPSTSVVEYN